MYLLSLDQLASVQADEKEVTTVARGCEEGVISRKENRFKMKGWKAKAGNSDRTCSVSSPIKIRESGSKKFG